MIPSPLTVENRYPDYHETPTFNPSPCLLSILHRCRRRYCCHRRRGWYAAVGDRLALDRSNELFRLV